MSWAFCSGNSEQPRRRVPNRQNFRGTIGEEIPQARELQANVLLHAKVGDAAEGIVKPIGAPAPTARTHNAAMQIASVSSTI